MGLRGSARQHDTNKSTLWKRVHGKTEIVGYGKGTLLGEQAEAPVVKRMLELQEVGYSLSDNQLWPLVAEVGSQQDPDNPFVQSWAKKGRAGQKWCRSFLSPQGQVEKRE